MSHDIEEHTNPGMASGIGGAHGFDDHAESEGTEEVTQVDHPDRPVPHQADAGHPSDFDDAVLDGIAVPQEDAS